MYSSAESTPPPTAQVSPQHKHAVLPSLANKIFLQKKSPRAGGSTEPQIRKCDISKKGHKRPIKATIRASIDNPQPQKKAHQTMGFLYSKQGYYLLCSAALATFFFIKS